MNVKSVSNKILYLDTSEETTTLMIFEDARIIAAEKWSAGRALSKTLSSRYGALLEKSQISQTDLSGIVVFVGPGSFTGLRIGISFANGLSFALGIPIYETKVKESFSLNNPQKIALPFYGAAPKITKPKPKI